MSNTIPYIQPEKAAAQTPQATANTAVAPEQKKNGVWQNVQMSFQNAMPQWVRDNSTRINQLGLMTGTSVMLHSVWKGKTIGKDIWDEQVRLLNEGTSLNQLELKGKISELVEAGIMKKPALHRERMIYLPTAILGLAVGGFIQDKETPEEREEYAKMNLPQYLGTRLKHSFDPLHHSRQTAALIGTASGLFAMWSGLTQPGGKLISEIFVGGTLVGGFGALGLINDPAQAKSALNVLWNVRLPFVISGTYETLFTKPTFTTPFAQDIKQTSEYAHEVAQAMQTGKRIPRFGLSGFAGYDFVKGGKAAAQQSKELLTLSRPYKRMDVAYPLGQISNVTMAFFGMLMAGSDEAKLAEDSRKSILTGKEIDLEEPAKKVESPALVSSVGTELPVATPAV